VPSRLARLSWRKERSRRTATTTTHFTDGGISLISGFIPLYLAIVSYVSTDIANSPVKMARLDKHKTASTRRAEIHIRRPGQVYVSNPDTPSSLLGTALMSNFLSNTQQQKHFSKGHPAKETMAGEFAPYGLFTPSLHSI